MGIEFRYWRYIGQRRIGKSIQTLSFCTRIGDRVIRVRHLVHVWLLKTLQGMPAWHGVSDDVVWSVRVRGQTIDRAFSLL